MHNLKIIFDEDAVILYIILSYLCLSSHHDLCLFFLCHVTWNDVYESDDLQCGMQSLVLDSKCSISLPRGERERDLLRLLPMGFDFEEFGFAFLCYAHFIAGIRFFCKALIC